MSDRQDIDGKKLAEVDSKIEALATYLSNLGIDRLAHEVSEERFRRRILESQRWIDAHDFHLSAEEKFQDTIEQRIISMQSQIFDKATIYNNFVITFGYAGFFAIWSFVKGQMHPWDTSLVALLLGVSLLLFILWTLGMALFSAHNIRQMGTLVNKEFETREEKVEAIVSLEAVQGKRALSIMSVWAPVFYTTALTGLMAGLILLALLFGLVLEIEFSLHSSKEQLASFLASIGDG